MGKENDDVVMFLGKRVSVISRGKYELLRKFILELLKERDAITLDDLLHEAKNRFDHELKGGIACYLLQVKLDLETRGMIKLHRNATRTQIITLSRSRLGKFYRALS